MAFPSSNWFRKLIEDALENTAAIDLNADTMKCALFTDSITGTFNFDTNTAYNVSPWNANEVLNVRFQVSGSGTTNLAAKVWKDGDVEPAGWTLSATDTTAGLQGVGGVGLWAYLSGSATNAPIILSVDDFSANPVA